MCRQREYKISRFGVSITEGITAAGLFMQENPKVLRSFSSKKNIENSKKLSVPVRECLTLRVNFSRIPENQQVSVHIMMKRKLCYHKDSKNVAAEVGASEPRI